MAPLGGTTRSPSHSARKPVLVLRMNPTLHPLETRVGKVGALASVRWPKRPPNSRCLAETDQRKRVCVVSDIKLRDRRFDLLHSSRARMIRGVNSPSYNGRRDPHRRRAARASRRLLRQAHHRPSSRRSPGHSTDGGQLRAMILIVCVFTGRIVAPPRADPIAPPTAPPHQAAGQSIASIVGS